VEYHPYGSQHQRRLVGKEMVQWALLEHKMWKILMEASAHETNN
jgi:hypothetical protein